MKSTLLYIALGLPAILTTAAGLAAQDSKSQPLRYNIIDLGTLGGEFSIAFDIDNAGRVTGSAGLAGGTHHAFLWDRSKMTDLGTLGGLDSGAGGKAGRTEFSVVSETADADPLAENFCGFNTGLICRAAMWRNGRISPPLATLGGNNGAAFTLNSQGQLVGVAEDGVKDSSCIHPQQGHFQAVTWVGGLIQRLAPLPGDQVGIALRNNDHGQVVGTSGLCSNTIYGGFGLGPHAVLWDHGKPTRVDDQNNDLGVVAVAAAINNRTEVFGGALYPDGKTHAFRWTPSTGPQDLGILSSDPADAANTPFDVNDSGQMVGASCDTKMSFCRGYVWQNGSYTDINTLIPADAHLHVLLPLSINAAGQIVGLALDTNTFAAHAFLATPNEDGDETNHVLTQTLNRSTVLPDSIRKLLQQRMRFGWTEVDSPAPR
jgi:probable HAF family extracellular repeat protein